MLSRLFFGIAGLTTTYWLLVGLSYGVEKAVTRRRQRRKPSIST